MDVVFDAKNLKRLRKIVESSVGLKLSDDETYACAISVIRFTCAKMLRLRELQDKEVKNGRKPKQSE